MRLERLEIHGISTAYPGTVNLSVRDLPRGLTALVGPIGEGKTILLEAGLAAPYRTLPSRERALADYAISRDAYLVAEYSFDGVGVLRARVSVDGESRNTKAVLEEIQPNGSGVPLNDGKASTFDAVVKERFPSFDLLMASVFACQTKKGSFSTQKPGARKDLFAEMLGLGAMERRAQTAGRASKIADAAREKLDIERGVLARDADPAIAADLQARANALQAEGGQIEIRRRELQDETEGLDAERAELQEAVTAHHAVVAQVTTLTAAIATRQAELTQIAADDQAARTAAEAERQRTEERHARTLSEIERRWNAEIERRGQQTAECDGRVSAEQQAHAATLKDLDTRITNNRTVLADAVAIRDAAAWVDEANQALGRLRSEEGVVRVELEAAREQVRVREKKLAEAAQAQRDLDTATAQAELLGRVKFGEQCGGADPCQFVQEAVSAQQRIPVLQARAAEATTLREGITFWTAKAADSTEELETIATQIAAAQQTIALHEPKARFAPHLDLAEERIREYEQQRRQASTDFADRITELGRQRAQVYAGVDARIADLKAEREHASADLRTAHTDITARLEERLLVLNLRERTARKAFHQAEQDLLAAQKEAERTKLASARVDLIEADLTRLRGAWTTNEAALAGLTARRQELDRACEAYTQKVARLADVERRLAQVNDQLRAWSLIAQALGKDGLQTLEIDEAGPAVTTATNDLLLAAGMTRFTVELVTQVEKADKKGLKESFELRVWDNERGGEWRDISDLSGGQKVIVEEAFRCGIALYMNAKNERPIRTTWRDETTGSLDADTAPKYVAMLRRMQEIGGFENVLLVSHNLEVAALCDAQVLVAHGAIEVVHQSAPELERWLSDVVARRAA